MFSFANYSRRFPINIRLSTYCTESTNNSIIKLTRELNEERKGILIKKYFNDKNNNIDNDDNDNNDNGEIIITIVSILSAFYFAHKFLYLTQ
jgi:hypothetical protein